jgi:AcrR family transcriptional regulator
MPRTQRPYHHGDLRKSLVAEAANLIESEGVAALTLRELARRLGVSHAAPTNHFVDKEALLVELAAQGFVELGESLASATQSRSPEARLRDIGRAYIRFALRRPGHYRVMFGRGFAKDVPLRVGEVGARAYSILEEAVVAALPAGRARSAQRVREGAFAAWSVVHGAAMLLLDAPLPAGLLQPGDERAKEALIEHATASIAASIAAGQ